MKCKLILYLLVLILFIPLNGCIGSNNKVPNTVNTNSIQAESSNVSNTLQSLDDKNKAGEVGNNQNSNTGQNPNSDGMAKETYRIGNTTGNLKNGGLVACDNEWIYYSNINDGMKLYKIKKDGTEKTKLYDGIVYYLNLVDNWIYCRVNNPNYSDCGMLYKIKTDGSESYKLAEAIVSLFVANNWIYFSDYSDDICKIDIQGNNFTSLVDPTFAASEMIFSDGYIYSIGFEDELNVKSPYLYKIKENGGEKNILMKGNTGRLIIDGNWIYFVSSGFNKIQIDGSQLTKISTEGDSNYNVADGWIYHRDESDGNKLYKVKTDGSGKVKLCDETPTRINIVDDWVYFYTDAPKYQFMRIKKDGSDLQTVD